MGHLPGLLASAAEIAKCGRPTCLEKDGPFFIQVAHFQGFGRYPYDYFVPFLPSVCILSVDYARLANEPIELEPIRTT